MAIGTTILGATIFLGVMVLALTIYDITVAFVEYTCPEEE